MGAAPQLFRSIVLCSLPSKLRTSTAPCCEAAMMYCLLSSNGSTYSTLIGTTKAGVIILMNEAVEGTAMIARE